MTRQTTSIVMCTYNGAAFLPMQLDSLLAQTRLPDEIVIGDDGSTDATMNILEQFESRASSAGVNVRLRRNPRNLGYVENFSVGLREACGELLFLCDQDDVWHVGKLSRMAAAFAGDSSLLLLHSNAQLVDDAGQSLQCTLFDALQLTAAERGAIHDGRAFDVVLRRSFVTGATAALRRELVATALPIAPGWVHDEWLAAVAAVTGRVDFIDETLIDYRQHAANQIGARKRTWATKWHDLLLPRASLLAREVSRLQHLETFLHHDTAADEQLSARVGDKRAHFERRLAMGQLARWRRLPAIAHERRLGCYQRYGTGVRSVLRDLLRHD